MGDEKEVNKPSSVKCSEFICSLVSVRDGLEEEHSFYVRGAFTTKESPLIRPCDTGLPKLWSHKQDMTELPHSLAIVLS